MYVLTAGRLALQITPLHLLVRPQGTQLHLAKAPQHDTCKHGEAAAACSPARGGVVRRGRARSRQLDIHRVLACVQWDSEDM